MKSKLVKELLAEKDPETLLRRLHNLPAEEVCSAMENTKLLKYAATMIRDNPQIRKKISQEINKEVQNNG